MKRGKLLLLAALAMSQAAHADAAVGCNFYTLNAAQRAAQTEAVNGQIPALLGQLRGEMTPVPLDGVYIPDKAIQRKIMAQSVFARRTSNNSIEVIARVVNCTDYPLQILGRTSFMDKNQIPTEDPSAWQTVFVNPHSFATYHEVSIGGTDVESYLIEFRSNR
jgi:hypothetical protein